MSSTTTVYRLTAVDLFQNYGVCSYGPQPQSNKIGTPGFTKSKNFELIDFVVPERVELTKELVQRVVGAWVNMNIQHQNLVRAEAKYHAYSGHASENKQDPNVESYLRAVQNHASCVEAWSAFQKEGYDITIIK